MKRFLLNLVGKKALFSVMSVLLVFLLAGSTVLTTLSCVDFSIEQSVEEDTDDTTDDSNTDSTDDSTSETTDSSEGGDSNSSSEDSDSTSGTGGVILQLRKVKKMQM